MDRTGGGLSVGKVFLICLAFVGAVGFFLAMVDTAGPPGGGRRSSSGELDAAVTWDRQSLTITNAERASWSNCGAELNPGVLSGYKTSISSIAAGGSVSIPWSSFLAGDGERFDIRRFGVKAISLHCDRGGSRAHYYGTPRG